ncbi:uncharacterized protein LOC135683559 isoform X2 [Rhopilema esculentum]|uniref:uncharacterized protein LOC135683559 isoform X2 n=1 Tax=Rhopilema esculentum TaxID=499914 RepID=UPI0031E017A7
MMEVHLLCLVLLSEVLGTAATINVTEPIINAPSGSIYEDVLKTVYTQVDATQSLAKTSLYVTSYLSRIYTSNSNGSDTLRMSTNEPDSGYVTTNKLISSLDLTTRNRKTELLRLITNLKTTEGNSSLPSVMISTVASDLSTDQAPKTSIIYPSTNIPYITPNSTTSQNNNHGEEPMVAKIFMRLRQIVAAKRVGDFEYF